jgi:helix-turn-helix protein
MSSPPRRRRSGVKRAVELFAIERRSSSSPFVDELWSSRSEPEDSFISVAAMHWEMCVTRQRGSAWLTVRGPHTAATITPIPADAEFFGIQFSLGTFMLHLQPGQLVDRALRLPQAKDGSFWLDRSIWELPRPDNADVFVDRLARAGLLAHDPVASTVLHDGVNGLSMRSLQRRVSRSTGLNPTTLRQIRRADTAVELLAGGMPARDAAHQAGYADQPHLTRSLRRFVGQTPAQIASS